MRSLVLRVLYGVAVLCSQLRILDRHRLIDGGVTIYIGHIIGKRTHGKSILIYTIALRQQFANETFGANIVHQIAEFDTAEWIIAQILYDSPTLGRRDATLVCKR